MTIKALTEITTEPLPGRKNDVFADCLPKWDPAIQAKGDEASGDVISIYDVIGETYDGGGVTDKRVAAALRSIGAKDVTVNINSPGGDYFAGVAIYSMLREHPKKVTVNILGLAASIASVIALAGDEVNIAKSGQYMIHNAWGFAIGNSAAMKKSAELLDHLDQSLIEVYADKTGLADDEIADMMAKETFLNGTQAIDMGFADSYLESDKVEKKARAESGQLIAARRLEHALVKDGLTRSERRNLLGAFKTGKQDAATPQAKQDAGDIVAGIRQLSHTLKS